MKTCLTCQEQKPLSDFYCSKFGIPKAHCIVCWKEKARLFYIKKSDKIKDRVHQYYAKNRQKIIPERVAFKKKWRKKKIVLIDDSAAKICSKCKFEKSIIDFHKGGDDKFGRSNECRECTALRMSGIYERDKVKITLRNRAYIKKNPDIMKVGSHNRRARKHLAHGKITKAIADNARQCQNDLCIYCQSPLNGGGHLDHKTPLARGGSNLPENLHFTCKTCNLRKSTKTHEEYIRFLARKAA